MLDGMQPSCTAPALGKHASCNAAHWLLAAPCRLSAVGRPIKVEKKEKPTSEELNALHQLYMDELSSLFDEHKGNYGVDKDVHLNFVWPWPEQAGNWTAIYI